MTEIAERRPMRPNPPTDASTVPLLAALTALFVFSGATGVAAIESAPFATPEASVRLVSAWSSAPVEGDPRLGLAFTLAPGWHVYWRNPGDAGYPPAFEPVGGSALATAELRYPAPERFELPGGLVAFGYEGEMIYPIDAHLTHGLSGSARIAGALDYLVCAESCIPYRAELALDLPLGEPVEDLSVAPALARWRAALPGPAVQVGQPGPTPPGQEALRVTASLHSAEGGALLLHWKIRGDGLQAVSPDLLFDIHELLAFERPRFVAAADGPGFEVALRPLDSTIDLPERLQIAWTATGFSRSGRPAAWHGTLDLESPRGDSMQATVARLLLALALFAIVATLVVRARHPSSPANHSLEVSE